MTTIPPTSLNLVPVWFLVFEILRLENLSCQYASSIHQRCAKKAYEDWLKIQSGVL
jgi:hypothetical protein